MFFRVDKSDVTSWYQALTDSRHFCIQLFNSKSPGKLNPGVQFFRAIGGKSDETGAACAGSGVLVSG
jgi:hypothetical protein